MSQAEGFARSWASSLKPISEALGRETIESILTDCSRNTACHDICGIERIAELESQKRSLEQRCEALERQCRELASSVQSFASPQSYQDEKFATTILLLSKKRDSNLKGEAEEVEQMAWSALSGVARNIAAQCGLFALGWDKGQTSLDTWNSWKNHGVIKGLLGSGDPDDSPVTNLSHQDLSAFLDITSPYSDALLAFNAKLLHLKSIELSTPISNFTRSRIMLYDESFEFPPVKAFKLAPRAILASAEVLFAIGRFGKLVRPYSFHPADGKLVVYTWGEKDDGLNAESAKVSAFRYCCLSSGVVIETEMNLSIRPLYTNVTNRVHDGALAIHTCQAILDSATISPCGLLPSHPALFRYQTLSDIDFKNVRRLQEDALLEDFALSKSLLSLLRQGGLRDRVDIARWFRIPQELPQKLPQEL